MPESHTTAERLCRLKENRGRTWRQIASDLGVSLSMALMVKSGARTLGPEALARLERLEQKTPNLPPPPPAKPRSAVGGRERVRLTVRDRERGFVEMDVSYSAGAPSSDMPRRLKISRPPEKVVENLVKVVADTWEVKIAVLACLPRDVATEDYLESLSTKSYLAIQSVALSLVFGERWRTVLAKAVVEGRLGPRSDLDRVTGSHSQ
jgi:transcriptional regulator with XRE-family HTH domain